MSKRKPLLTESELRRFMKLATIQPVADVRLTEMGYGPPPGQREEEELDVEAGGEMPDPMGGEEDIETDAELDVEEFPEEGDELEGGGAEEDLVISLLQAIQGWAEENGVDMDLEGGEEEIGGDELEGGEEELALGGEEELEGGGEELEVGAEEEMEEPMMEEAKVVETVAKRVLARLKAENNKEKMVDQLAERIMKRLTK